MQPSGGRIFINPLGVPKFPPAVLYSANHGGVSSSPSILAFQFLITNVGDYQNPKLFRKINGKWEQVNQEVHGSDFWQTEFNATNGTWDITYNVNLDSEKDERQEAEFKFSIR